MTTMPEVLETLLGAVADAHGTDLLLTTGSDPLVRIDGSLRPVAMGRRDGDTMERILRALFDAGQLARF